MTPDQFNLEIARLNESFKSYYTKSRIRMVWDQVCGLDAKVFTSFVNKAIWWDRPPNIESFGNLARNNRYVAPEEEKQRFENELWGVFRNEDISEMVQMTMKKMSGEISREEFEAYVETRRRTVEIAQQNLTGERT